MHRHDYEKSKSLIPTLEFKLAQAVAKSMISNAVLAKYTIIYWTNELHKKQEAIKQYEDAQNERR
jgi:hypothetical protein